MKETRWVPLFSVLTLGVFSALALLYPWLVAPACGSETSSWESCAGARWALATRNCGGLDEVVSIAAALLGVPLGVLSALGDNSLGRGLSRLLEMAGTVPSLILVVIWRFWDSTGGVVALVGTLAMIRTLELAQVVRTEVHDALRLPHVAASRAMGASRRWQLRVHILPSLRRPLGGHLASGASWVLGLEAALGLVGLGLGDHVPSWGAALRFSVRGGPMEAFVLASSSLVAASLALHGLSLHFSTESRA